MRFLWAGCAALSGCATCPPLGDVPIDGGSSEQRTAVAAELSFLEGALALPACVDHVRIGSVPGKDNAGTYERVTHRVALLEDLETDDLTAVLRHEVCHAVDLQNDLVKADEDPFFFDVAPEGVDAMVPNEAFADTCWLGPDALRAVWGAECPGDPDLRAASFVLDRVWVEEDTPEPGAELEPVASVSFHDAALSLGVDLASSGLLRSYSVDETAEHGRLRVSTEWEAGPPLDFEVEGSTGEILEGRAGLGLRGDAMAIVAPPGWAPLFSEGGHAFLAAEIEGLTVSLAGLELPTGWVRRAHVRLDGGDWAPAVAPCVPDEMVHFFYFGEELWMATADEVEVRWGRWVKLRDAR